MANNEHFKKFHDTLETKIDHFWSGRPGQTMATHLLEVQREQVEKLVALEKEFKLALITQKRGIEVYRKFVEHICEERGNILDARPFFRERQGVFKNEISVALKAKRARALIRFRFNYRFVRFALGAFKWAPGSKVVKISEKIKKVREELVQTNLPLACSRARDFFSRTPRSHLEHMDLVQIACEGLISAVDKFVPPFSKAFRDVAIGRMTGNFIEQYSETLLHFFPKDKRKLYRLHKLMAKNPENTSFLFAAERINAGDGKKLKKLEGAQRTNESEISHLSAASSVISAEAVGTEDNATGSGIATRTIERYAAPPEVQPDVIVEREDGYAKLKQASKLLTLRQRKILILRGISEDSLY